MDTSFLTNFKDKYADLEEYRQKVAMKVNRWYLLIVILTVSVTVAIIYYGLEADSPLVVLSFIPPVAGPIVLFSVRSKTVKLYRDRYKKDIILPLVSQVSENLEYNPNKGILGVEFRRSGLYPEAISSTTSEDLIYGKHKGIEFRFSELLVQHKTYNYSQMKTSAKSITVFKGIFMAAENMQNYTGRHVVIRKNENNGLLNLIGDFWEMADKQFGDAYRMGDEIFDNKYKIYSTNKEEAIEVFSPILRSKLLYFATISEVEFRLSFTGSKIYMAIQTDHNLFEPVLQKPLTDSDILKEHFANITHIIQIVEIFGIG